MPAEKTTAIVLKVVDFSETSCVVTLMTREFGKISALAKGARRPKSPFEAALDLLAICRIVFLRKSADTLDLLTEAKLQRRFRSGSRDLLRLYAGLYVIELLTALTDHHDPHPELFDLACDVIEQIDAEADTCAQLLRFELYGLTLLGHQPALEDCVSCGRPIVVNGRVSFGLLLGGVLCGECRVGKRSVIALSPETLDKIKLFSDPAIQLDSIELSAKSRGEMRGLMDQYIANLIGLRPKMFPYLRQIFK